MFSNEITQLRPMSRSIVATRFIHRRKKTQTWIHFYPFGCIRIPYMRTPYNLSCRLFSVVSGSIRHQAWMAFELRCGYVSALMWCERTAVLAKVHWRVKDICAIFIGILFTLFSSYFFLVCVLLSLPKWGFAFSAAKVFCSLIAVWTISFDRSRHENVIRANICRMDSIRAACLEFRRLVYLFVRLLLSLLIQSKSEMRCIWCGDPTI